MKRLSKRELRETTVQEDILDFIISQRLRCLGQIARMDEDRLPKRVLDGRVEGKRKVVRPWIRWYSNDTEGHRLTSCSLLWFGSLGTSRCFLMLAVILKPEYIVSHTVI